MNLHKELRHPATSVTSSKLSLCLSVYEFTFCTHWPLCYCELREMFSVRSAGIHPVVGTEVTPGAVTTIIRLWDTSINSFHRSHTQDPLHQSGRHSTEPLADVPTGHRHPGAVCVCVRVCVCVYLRVKVCLCIGARLFSLMSVKGGEKENRGRLCDCVVCVSNACNM